MATEATPTPELTAGELRRAIAKAEDVYYWTHDERTNLDYGAKRIAERVGELARAEIAIHASVESAKLALAEAEKLPRGRRVRWTKPDYPAYNRHRRLAVMELSIL
jgi:hypothetical protein